MIDIDVLSRPQDEVFNSIRAEWKTLFSASSCAPFLSWEWMSTWFRHFGNDRSPYVLRLSRGGTIIGLCPMYVESKSFLGSKEKILHLMGDGPGGADQLDVVCHRDDRVEALAAILAFLSKDASIDSIRLASVAGDSPVIHLAESASRQVGSSFTRCSQAGSAICPQIDLSKGWESVLANSKRKSNYKRRLKDVEKLPDYEYRSITEPNDVLSAFDRFLELHQKRWEAAGGSELSGHPRLISFQREIVSKLGEVGLIRFEELWLGGACRSSVYGLDNGKTFYYYNSGYDQDYAHKSVGLVLLGLSIKSAVSRGNQLYDFLRGDETYKFDWANQTVETVDITLGRQSLAAAAADGLQNIVGGFKKVGKAALPKALVTSLANRRRSWKRSYQMSGQ